MYTQIAFQIHGKSEKANYYKVYEHFTQSHLKFCLWQIEKAIAAVAKLNFQNHKKYVSRADFPRTSLLAVLLYYVNLILSLFYQTPKFLKKCLKIKKWPMLRFLYSNLRIVSTRRITNRPPCNSRYIRDCNNWSKFFQS